jgi:membrane protein required for colicin V production
MGLGFTQFDVVVLVLLAISAAVGFARGAVREIFAVVALVVAAILAVFCLPIATPFARHLTHTGWLAATASLAVVFIVAYVALRVVGGALAKSAQRTSVLGALDRSLGLAIGLGRGLVVLGSLYLMFNAATPVELQPHWITGASTWPTARNMGRLLTSLAPQGLDLAGRLKPAFDRAMKDGSRDRSATGGYDARQLGDMDDLVEKSR